VYLFYKSSTAQKLTHTRYNFWQHANLFLWPEPVVWSGETVAVGR